MENVQQSFLESNISQMLLSSADEAPSIIKDSLLTSHAVRVCRKHGLEYRALPIFTRKLITHYLCEKCKLQPLYHIDIVHLNKPRCALCGSMIKLGRSRFTRLRKEILLSLQSSLFVQQAAHPTQTLLPTDPTSTGEPLTQRPFAN